eukprot:GILI01015105.1.p1 GENE.GILI01015105.1~~GILI01015105.1.p1  ORF type:complete len:307 (+),score=69.92 GILI01015105.1:68-988(+)
MADPRYDINADNPDESGTEFKISFVRSAIAECMGTLMFVFVASSIIVGSGMVSHNELTAARLAVISIGIGLAYSAIVYIVDTLTLGRSGYLNPAISFVLALTNGATATREDPKGRWSRPWSTFFVYLLSQMAGSIVGAFLSTVAVPNSLEVYEKAGETKLGFGETSSQGFMFEVTLAYFLVFTIYGSAILRGGNPTVQVVQDGSQKIARVDYNMHMGGCLAIGFTMAALHLVAYPFTGASFNWVRSFGPAIMSGYWREWWIYMWAPLVGSIISAISYILFFTRIPLERAFSSILPSESMAEREYLQ